MLSETQMNGRGSHKNNCIGSAIDTSLKKKKREDIYKKEIIFFFS